MVFKSLDGSSAAFWQMNMWGNKLVIYLLIKSGLLEEITSFISHDLELGLVSSSFDYVKEFLDPFVDACA